MFVVIKTVNLGEFVDVDAETLSICRFVIFRVLKMSKGKIKLGLCIDSNNVPQLKH